MAQVIWTEPARTDLEAIHDYIALESPAAALGVVARILRHVDQLARHPDSGSWLPELGRSRYRQLVEPPCRIFYRRDGRDVAILHVIRSERVLDVKRLEASIDD
ncbi:MAG TPA: type II toxin-antitoxin system RelE/ParE family toxin [Rhodanobacteraceae bacterium]|nr:type II toxin-antitoxin system RelE/ParE family toxin [Rhodanobacteraceae bacterium]